MSGQINPSLTEHLIQVKLDWVFTPSTLIIIKSDKNLIQLGWIMQNTH
jgi:hypothetical protein